MRPPASSDVGAGRRPRADGGRGPAGAELTIGEVLTHLRPDFPDITISKIRFLESEGLIEPRRSPSGYRKFSAHDIERLRYVLTAQRDHYLPLRVIKEHLDAIDRGLEPPAVGLPGPRVPDSATRTQDPSTVGAAPRSDLRLSLAELSEASGLATDLIDDLHDSGLIGPGPEGYFDADALAVARAVAELSAYGVEIRHLRPLKTAADRQIGLIEQMVAPLLVSRPDRARDIARTVAASSIRLHAALVRSGVRRLVGD